MHKIKRRDNLHTSHDVVILCVGRSTLDIFCPTLILMSVYVSRGPFPMLFHLSPNYFVRQEIPFFL